MLIIGTSKITFKDTNNKVQKSTSNYIEACHRRIQDSIKHRWSV